MKPLLWILGALAVALAAWACGGEAATTAPVAAPAVATTAPAVSAEPIKIGLIHPHTGPLAGLGKTMTDGWELYWNEQGMEIAGRPIELLIEDTEGQADVGLDKLKKLVERDGVDIVAGPISSGVAYGIGGYAKAKGVPIFITQATANLLTQADENRAPNIFRTVFSSDQLHLPMGKYFYDELGYRKMLVMAQDYAAGWEHASAFIHAFKAAGGEAEPIYPPLGETELAPYLTEVLAQAGDIDAFHAIMWGASAVPTMNQAFDFGIRDKIDITALDSAVAEGLELPNENPDAVDGIINYGGWCLCLDTPENKAFIESFTAFKGRPPNNFTAVGYTNARAIGEAIKAAGGNVEDTEAFLKAARGVKFAGPRGPFRFDGHQNAVVTVYVRRVEKGPDGNMVNVLVKTIENVSQYWPAEVTSYDDPIPAGFPLGK